MTLVAAGRVPILAFAALLALLASPPVEAGEGRLSPVAAEPEAQGPAKRRPRRPGNNQPLPNFGQPYPSSDLITGFSLDWSTFRSLASGSDNWPVSWAADGTLYSAWGDGGGFGPDASRLAYVPLGVATLTGSSAATLDGRNLISGLVPALAPCFPYLSPAPANGRTDSPCFRRGISAKSRGVLALDGSLYLWLTPGSGTTGYRFGRIARAAQGANAWTMAPWGLGRGTSPGLVFPTFLQAGRDHADLPDGHVYSYAARYAPRNGGSGRLDVQVGPGGGEVHLLRHPRANPLAPPEYSTGDGGWSGSPASSRPVFADRNGTGPRVSAFYVRELGRYILMSGHTREFSSQLGMFEAPNPWGPWRTVFYGTLGAGAGVPLTAFFYGFLPNAFSADGRRFTFLFTGVDRLDALNVVDGSFALPGQP